MNNNGTTASRTILLSLILSAALLTGLVALIAVSERPALASAPPPAAAATTVRYVAPGGDCGPVHPCYHSPQDAIDAAGEGDEIRLAAGTYTPMGDQVVRVDKTVWLRGGYTTTNWAAPDPVANPTTLSGQDVRRVVHVAGPITPTLEGLRIVRGVASRGGGIYVQDASITLRNNWILGNHAQGEGPWQFARGGGVYLLEARAHLHGNRLENNTAVASGGGGGGLYADRSDVELRGNLIQGNQAGLFCSGGGAYITRSDVVLRGNTFVSNTSESAGGGLYLMTNDVAVLLDNSVIANGAWDGGGLYVDATDAALNRNVITANQADEHGAGVYLKGSDALLANTLLVDNRSLFAGSGAGLYVVDSSPQLLHATIARNFGGDGSAIHVASGSAALTNTILVSHTVGIRAAAGSAATLEATLWGSGPWRNEADWEGAGTIITGTPGYNLWADPAFVAPDAGDYHLAPGSPAIDAGVPTWVRTDIDGEPRFGVPDLGADEYWAPGALKRSYLPLVVKGQ